MTRTLCLCLLLFASACEKREQPPVLQPPPVVMPAAPSASPSAQPSAPLPKARPDSLGGSQIAVPLGTHEAPPELAFKIVKAYAAHKPSEQPPYHEPGGNWLFFDAQIEGAAPARFSFGVEDVKPAGELPIAFASGQFSVADRAQGAALTAALAGAFKQALPAPTAERPLAPLKMRLVVLGRGVTRLPSGGFQGIGNWTSTKLFAQLGGHEGEVFFNFSPASGKGEFSEKDSDYNQDVVAVFALLRDGLPPAKKAR